LPTKNKKIADEEKRSLITVPKEISNSPPKNFSVSVDTNESFNQPELTKKDHVKKNSSTFRGLFSHQEKMNEGRNAITASDNLTKLVPIRKQFINQCYSISVFQLRVGIKEFWQYVIMFCTQGKTSVDEFIITKPFTTAALVMGGILSESWTVNKLQNKLPQAVPFATIQFCRTKHVPTSFSTEGQEDASEFMGMFLDKVQSENPGGVVGRNINVSSFIKKYV
jgi:ubiquitin C-terminal hydrolase